MSESVNRRPAASPLSALPALVAVVASPPGRAVLRCLTGCAMRALEVGRSVHSQDERS
ncbi:hypothetical protein [Catenulispora pinisilvae]|uniref:hypothetical protein n=1 Tax=Catenulispora pinisilvae TaxID=2705253 RepID=UPI0018911E75|nr:hypothetical protein [Catenulispora pinisilvae]